MATDYATLDEVRAYGKFGASETGDDTLLESLITRVSKLFDSKCGREIVPSDDAVHYFSVDDIAVDDYDGGVKIGDLMLDETLLSVTSILNGDADATAIDASNYFLMPRAYERKSYIRMKAASTVSWKFATDGMVAITGKWGYTLTIPGDVNQAVIESVLYTYHRRGDNLKITDRPQQSNDGTRYLPIAWTAFAKEVIEHYRKRV